MQRAQPVEDAGGADDGGGAQCITAPRGGLLQVVVEQVGAGEVGLRKAAGSDPPRLVVLQRCGAQLDGPLGLPEVTQALAEVRRERGFGIDALPRRLACPAARRPRMTAGAVSAMRMTPSRRWQPA